MQRLILILCSMFLAAPASASVIYSGLQNISLPYDAGGIYVNLLTAATSSTEPGSIETAPWVFANFGGSGLGTNPLVRTIVTGSVVSGAEQTEKLTYGAVVSSLSRFSVGDSGWNGSETHIGAAIYQFQLGTQGYLGYEFEPTVGGPSYFGFMSVTLANDGMSAMIHDWYYENTAGMPIGVPEPSRSVLLLGGLIGLASRRRRS